MLVGPGDDAPVVTSGSGELVLTTDAMVEDVHFRLDQTTPQDLGYKAIAIDVSDVAAMAGSPRYAVCALTSRAPRCCLGRGARGGDARVRGEFALALVGGNLSRGPAVSVAVTVTGEVGPGRAVRRDGARPGDSRGGHRIARRGGGGPPPPARQSWSDEERDALRRWMRPTPRVGEGRRLFRTA